MTELIIMTICSIVVIALLIYLLFLPAVITMIKMAYYEKVEGFITDKEIKLISTPDASGNFAHYKYEFEYQNKTYHIEDKGYGHNKRLNIGDRVNIYVKKGNPEVYIYPNLVRDRYINLLIALVSMAPVIFLLILFLFLI